MTRHVAKGWLSDICLCGEEFTDRMLYYSHSARCKQVLAYRIASGQYTANDLAILKSIGELGVKK